MKKSIIYIFAASILLLFASCNDFLDKTPRDTFTNSPKFWSNSNDVQSYSNKFYDDYIGFNHGGSFGWFYFKSLSDDQANASFDNWTYITVPATSSNWSGNFTEVRRANYSLQGLETSTLPASDKLYYSAIDRLNRAWAYYQLVREYGDVQWIDYPILDLNDTNIYGKRTDRDVVMDSVLNDLDYAITNLPSNISDKTKWSKEMAEAMKSDICLYEGTYCKYRTLTDNGKAPDLDRAKKYLQESEGASEAIMSSGRYSLTPNYGDIYNSLDLSSNPEIIFYRNYEKDIVMHGTVDYTSGSSEQLGITKDAINAFLFKDGKPLATTTLDKDDKAVENQNGNYSVEGMLKNRDKRLSVLIDSIICFKNHSWARLDENGNTPTAAQQMTSSTGYTIRKYDNTTLDSYYRNNTNTNYTDCPLYWYAVILLNEAEAKAELGTITQSDLNQTINLLQSRAGLPDMTTQPDADPANNMGVSNLIWEIRRCRRCELMTDNWYRYWDLVRWHQLDKLDSQQYPDINRGANVSNVKDSTMTVDNDKYLIGTVKTRTFD
ncbi:MAG: RagB/SusD family nutrient uptake outer membrane protein, partial [Prevotella sp.]|nr:RagB/SusD family nutrient uptake outer membrane protein [Prevotella sp.]